MEGRRSRPEETPPSRRAGRLAAWLGTGIAGVVGIAFLVLALAVVLIVLLG